MAQETVEKFPNNPKKLSEAFPAYKNEIANLKPVQKEQLKQWTQKYDIIRYLLSGKPFKYDLDGDGIPETIKWGIPFDQIRKLGQELSQTDEQKQKEIIQQSLKAYVELQDLKEDLFLNLESKDIIPYLRDTSLFSTFVEYFESKWASTKEAIEQTEKLSKAINGIWELYLERALPPEFDAQNVKSLSVGFSFGFMKWLVYNPQKVDEVIDYIAKLNNVDPALLVESGLKAMWKLPQMTAFFSSSTQLVKKISQNKEALKPKRNKALKDPSIWADVVSNFLQDPKNYDPIQELKKYICQPPFNQECRHIDEKHLKDIAEETAELLKQNPQLLQSMEHLANLEPTLRQINEWIQEFKNSMVTNPVWGALINWLYELQQMIGSLNQEWWEKLKEFLDNIMFRLGFRGGIEAFWIEKARALQLSLKPSLDRFFNQQKENLKGTIFENEPWNKIQSTEGNLTSASLEFFKHLNLTVPVTPKDQINLIKRLFNANEKKGPLSYLVKQALTSEKLRQRFEQYQFLLKMKGGKVVLDLNDLDKIIQAYIDFEKQKNQKDGVKKFDEFLIKMQTQYFVFESTTQN